MHQRGAGRKGPSGAAMFAAGAAAGDWALKRILKFVLKRSLRHVIKTQIDLEQLSVQLGQGRLELREVLLNTDYFNEQLVRVCVFACALGWGGRESVCLRGGKRGGCGGAGRGGQKREGEREGDLVGVLQLAVQQDYGGAAAAAAGAQ